MPYVNIPESGLGGATAKIVGKLQGIITAQVLKKANEIVNKLNKQGCPKSNDLKRLRQQKQQLDSAISSISGKLSKFKKLPKKLKAPVKGFKAALKIILSLPIPQAVPPGIGLPINITTKYADILHLLKEFIKQIEEIIQSIEVVLDTPGSTLGSIERILSRADGAIKVCELGEALEDEIEKGNITPEELIASGIYDSQGSYALEGSNRNFFEESPDRRFRGKWLTGVDYLKDETVKYKDVKWSCLKDHTSNIDGGKETGPPGVGPWKTLSSVQSDSSNSLLKSLESLNGSNISTTAKENIRGFLDTFKPTEKAKTIDDSKFYHTGPDGETYTLEIINDINSPDIAPRRFAIASTISGIVKFKGQKSFSSSTEVLLKEIKFRIDNQLP